MEILILVLLYYLSQNPHFAESVQPLMSKIKDSEQMLNFLKDLSKFSEAFGGFSCAGKSANNPSQSGANTHQAPPTAANTPQTDTVPPNPQEYSGNAENKKSPQSPTAGIADEFIQNILESYLNKN